MVYRLREEGGVPVTLLQLSRLSKFRIEARQCRPMGQETMLADWLQPSCPFLSKFPLPHSGQREVSEKLDTMSDTEVLSALGGVVPFESGRLICRELSVFNPLNL